MLDPSDYPYNDGSYHGAGRSIRIKTCRTNLVMTMTCNRLILCRSIACLLCSLITAGGLAQKVNADPPGFGAGTTTAAANEVTQFKGTLKGLQSGVLSITREDGTEVMVQQPDDIASFTFVATAKPAFLQRGNLVRFSGVFGPTGMAAAPIEKVEVFQPVQANRLQGHAREKFIPGIYPADRHAPKKPVAMAKYNVVGNLMGVNAGGIMMVQAGKQPVQVPLAKDATFELRYNNLNLAKEGDAVSVSGFYQPPDDTKVKADRVTITTDRVYGEATEQTPTRRPRGTRRDKAEDKEESAEQKAGDEAAEKNDEAGDEAQ